MATLRSVGTRALNMLGARGLGDDPSSEELSLVLTAAQAMYLGWVGATLGGPLTDVLTDENYEARENERITVTSGTPTITRPDTVTDPYTALERPPLDGAIVQEAGGDTYVYVRASGAWVQLNALTLDSAQPLGEAYDDAVAALLAVRVAPDLRRSVSNEVGAAADAGKRAISARFGPRLRGTIDRALWQRRGRGYNWNVDA